MKQTLGFMWALSALVAAPSHAADARDQVFALHGACTTLQLGTEDVTHACQGKLVSFTLGNGRVGFIFTVGDEGILQFSGPGSRQKELPGEHASQPIDRMRFTLAKTAPDAASTSPAVGTCVYGNPFAGTAKISCRVNSGRRLFIAEFVTDGSPPDEGGF